MSARQPQQVCAVLLDIQGTVLSEHAEAYPGAAEAIERLRALGVAIRFVTNIDSVPVDVVVARLADAGVHASHDEVFTPAAAVLRFLEAEGSPRCHLVLPEAVAEEFAAFVADDGAAEYVVVGDCREGFTYDRLNVALRHLMDGAELIALQKGRYFLSPDGAKLDTGAFVSALEYASGREARVFGKPSTELLHLAIADASCEPGECVMVGDDVTSDIAAAHAVGALSVLVRTGKFSLADLERSEQRPDLVVDSIADLPGALGELSR